MKNNKYKVFSIIAIFLAVLIFGFPGAKTANSKVITNVPADISSKELRAVVVEDFETPAEYTLETVPKKNTDPKRDPVPTLQLKYIDSGPADLKAEKWSADKKGMEKKKVLGVHFRFKYPGYNRVDIIPPLEVQWDDPSRKITTYDSRTGKYIQENAIQLPGQARGLSMWVHGRGDDYYLDCWVKDWKGEVHILKFGSLNYVGWKPLMAEIPRYIPQEVETYPQTKLLKVIRFVIRSTPDAAAQDTYIFFDQLKVLTDIYEVNFDGQELDKAFNDGSAPSTAPSSTPKEKK
ncbi:MAG: flagellar filament outer layer protein FlaA [Spirochaetota bacterium]